MGLTASIPLLGPPATGLLQHHCVVSVEAVKEEEDEEEEDEEAAVVHSSQ